jgi:hypothetical protein
VKAKRAITDMRLDCADAFNRAGPYHNELRSIYRYFMPFREPTTERSPEGGSVGEGQSRVDHLYDGTGVASAANFAGLMQADWMPPGQEFFRLEAGPFLADEAMREDLDRALANVSKRVHAVMPRVQLTAHEMFYDLFAGTGAMWMAKGDARTMIKSQAVPVVELALEEGPDGDVSDVYWKRKYKLRHLRELWPDGKFSKSLLDEIRTNRKGDCEVTQYTYWDHAARRWRLAVWCDKGDTDAAIWKESFNTTPWITPRMYKVPGEAYGRGLAHIGLPFVKTLSRAQELQLKAAVFAILGVWMRRDDGVFNPETAVFDPMAMWSVATTGGPLGASVQRLPIPDDFSISNIVIEKERQNARRVLLDDELPDEQDAVRSATEVAARVRRYARNRGGTGARLSYEMVRPMVERGADILHQFGGLPTRLTIDDVQTKVVVTAPAAASLSAHKVEAYTNWMQIIIMLMGPQAAMLTSEIETALPQLGRWLGVDADLIRKKADIKGLKDKVAELIAQQAAADNMPKPPTPSPQQPYMNGAM